MSRPRHAGMIQMKYRRGIAWTLVIAVLSVMVFASVFIVANADHHCHGEHCQVCHEIDLCLAALDTLAVTGLAVFTISLLSRIAAVRTVERAKRRPHPTLITLKVKLSI